MIAVSKVNTYENYLTQKKTTPTNSAIEFTVGNPTVESLSFEFTSTSDEITKAKEQFGDMYVSSSAHRFFSSDFAIRTNLFVKGWRESNAKGYMQVPIEAGELPQFMERVQNALAEGKTLETVLKEQYDRHTNKYQTYLNDYADWFGIDPQTGEVAMAAPVSRMYHGNSENEMLKDQNAVLELADDLASFFRYAVFSQSDDDPEKVQALLSFIKNKQAFANNDRFLYNENIENAASIIEANLAAGVLKSDVDNSEEGEEKFADDLMKAIKIHQEELRDNKIDIQKSRRAIVEMQEISENKEIMQ